jgi:predicted dehydrogenase
MSYRVAVVGGGGIAARHLEAAAGMEELVPVAVAELREERARELAAAYGLRPYTDYRAMLERERPDIAIVTLPHHLHKEAAICAAELGCHVLLEKPMALSTAECDAIMAAVRRSGVTLMVGHTQHYIAENRAAKALIAGGELGEWVMIQDTRHVPYDRPDRPAWFFDKAKAGGGILTNLGSHSIDKIQWLTGSPIVSALASVSYPLGRGDVEGGGVAMLRTASGVPAVMSQSGYPGAPRNETELVFRKGMIKLVTGRSLWISTGGEYRQVEVEPGPEPLALQLRELVASIEEKREPECSPAYSRGVVAVVESLYRSHAEGGVAVAIQFG